MDNNRRRFLKLSGLLGTGLAGGALQGFTSGNQTESHHPLLKRRLSSVQQFNMCGYAAPKLNIVRIGYVGLGNRGGAAVPRMIHIDGISVNALCDIRQEKAEAAKAMLKETTFNPALYYGNEDAWKKLCEREDIDLVYIATPWDLHAPIATYAMNHGKHVAVEVGPANTLDECWEMVEASERNKRHCVILENCCYDFFELLTLNMARQGFFGEIVHGAGAYLHEIAPSFFDKKARYNLWRLRENAHRNGNLYPTHGLGPVCQIMNINRGDKMDYLVSVSSNDFTINELAKEAAAKDKDFLPFVNSPFIGNMNTSTIRTHRGKTILVQHDISSPRPYSRIHQISGTKGIAVKYPEPGRIATGDKDWATEAQMKQYEEKYTLPIVSRLGEMAKQVGGHGGMDFLMDWRLIDCLRNGLPMDHDVYDAALWSAIAPLSEWSVAHRSNSIEVPDFSRGSWEKNIPVNMSIDHGNLTSVK